MSQFQIQAVKEDTRQWKTKAGNPWVSYTVQFKGEQGQGEAELARPADTLPPTVGETVEAEIEHTNFGAKLREARQSASKATGGYKGRNPQEQAMIARQSAQKAALKLLETELTIGSLKAEEIKGKSLQELLTPRIDYFFNDTMAAGKDS